MERLFVAFTIARIQNTSTSRSSNVFCLPSGRRCHFQRQAYGKEEACPIQPMFGALMTG
jgi:hypothetical protein